MSGIMSAFGTKRTCAFALQMSANDPKQTSKSVAISAQVAVRVAA